MLNRLIEQKQLLLDELLLQINIASKTLEDDFSQRKLSMQRELAAIKKTLREEITVLEQEKAVVINKLITSNNELIGIDQKIAILRTDYERKQRLINELVAKRQDIQTELIVLRTEAYGLKASIGTLRQHKKDLEDDLVVQTDLIHKSLADLKADYAIEKKRLTDDITDLKRLSADLKSRAIQQRSDLADADAAYKQKEGDLIRRENALLVKLKMLANEKQELETEKRRWNYVNPGKMDV